MEFYNKIIINVVYIFIIGAHELVTLLVTEPLSVYEPLPTYIPSACI